MENIISTQDFDMKVLGQDDTHVRCAFKITVTNNSKENYYANIAIQGIDEDGFEVCDTYLDGNILAGQETVLTTSTYINLVDYSLVTAWKFDLSI